MRKVIVWMVGGGSVVSGGVTVWSGIKCKAKNVYTEY